MPPTHERINVLIVGLSPRMRESLKALLSGQYELSQILNADSVQTALGYMSDHRPSIVFVAYERSDEEIRQFFRQVQERRPGIYTVGLVENPRKMPEAIHAGVNSVLIRGFSHDELTETIMQAVRYLTGVKQGGNGNTIIYTND